MNQLTWFGATRPNKTLVVLVALSLFVLYSKSNAQDDSGRKTEQPGSQDASPQQADSQSATENRTNTINRIATELDDLIPGTYLIDAPIRKILIDMATHYVDGNAVGFNKSFDELEKAEANMPPRGLLMAGINYTINRAQEGRQMLERAAIDSPNHPSIPIAFCRLALSQGRLLDARALVEMAQRLVDSSEEPAQLRSLYQLQLIEAQVTVAMRQFRYDEALAFAIEWEKADAQNGKMFISRAEIEFQKGNIETSLLYIGKFRAVTPNSRPTELVMAKWFQQKGDNSGTEKWVKKAAQMYPNNSLVQLEFANWAVSQEDFTTAMTTVGKLELEDGETLATKLIKGRIAFAKETYGVAESHFSDLYQKQSNNFDVSNMYALSLIESKDPAKQRMAREIAQRNLQGLPNSQVARAAFGWILLKQGNMGDAKQVLDQAARVQRLPPEIAYFMAVRFFKEGKSENAKKLLEAAVKHDGMFLYRSKARGLLKEIVGTAFLPDPAK